MSAVAKEFIDVFDPKGEDAPTASGARTSFSEARSRRLFLAARQRERASLPLVISRVAMTALTSIGPKRSA
jgi:hypothetical protein